MSRSDRDAAAKPADATTTRGDPFPDVPYRWMVCPGMPPSSLSGGMRTVDPPPGVGANRPEEFEPPYLVECAAAVIQQMEAARGESISSEDERTRLAFTRTSNCVTGEPGIVIRRMLEPGRYSDPLAELLVPAGEFEKYDTASLDRLGWSLAKLKVRIAVYRGESERGRPAAFAVVTDDEDPDRFWLLARLLVTPFEISQWWDPSVDAPSGSIH